jgi:hypothetical protein
VAAVNEAQDAARARHAVLVDPQALAAAVDEADLAAERRLAEFSTLVSDLIRHRGANLLANADYEATVCRAGNAEQTHRFGIEVGAPKGTPRTVQPGRTIIYGLP